jgi:hypothetical protein
MASSWMLRRLAIVKTDVSEERRASIIRVTRIGELGTLFPVYLTLGVRVPGTHWKGGWVDLSAHLNDIDKIKIHVSRDSNLETLSRPARRQALFRLRYHGHCVHIYSLHITSQTLEPCVILNWQNWQKILNIYRDKLFRPSCQSMKVTNPETELKRLT